MMVLLCAIMSAASITQVPQIPQVPVDPPYSPYAASSLVRAHDYAIWARFSSLGLFTWNRFLVFNCPFWVAQEQYVMVLAQTFIHCIPMLLLSHYFWKYCSQTYYIVRPDVYTILRKSLVRL